MCTSPGADGGVDCGTLGIAEAHTCEFGWYSGHTTTLNYVCYPTPCLIDESSWWSEQFMISPGLIYVPTHVLQIIVDLLDVVGKLGMESNQIKIVKYFLFMLNAPIVLFYGLGLPFMSGLSELTSPWNGGEEQGGSSSLSRL